MLTREDALALAQAIAGPCEGEEAAARKRVVLTALGGLAVAVEMASLAVVYCEESWVWYENELAKVPEELLGDEEKEELKNKVYDKSAFTALDLSIGLCPKGAARDLLECLAALGPERVPMDWAEAGADLQESAPKSKYAWKTHESLCLVKVDAASREAALHRLVHRRLRTTLSAEALDHRASKMAESVVSWLKATVGPGGIAQVEERQPHLKEVFSAVQRRREWRTWVSIANQLATNLWSRGEHVEARDQWAEALARAEQLDPPDRSLVAVQLSDLAVAYRDLEEPERARPLLERALEIELEECPRPSDEPRVALRLSNLSGVLLALHEKAVKGHPVEGAADLVSRAREYAERALAIDEKNARGRPDTMIATDLACLARVHMALGDPGAALPHAERALRIEEDPDVHGPDHPKVARRLFLLASVLRRLGDLEGAERYLERTVDIQGKRLGLSHPDLVRSRSELAAVRSELRARASTGG